MECNLKKGEKTLESSGMGLLRQPKKPRWSPFNQIAFRRGVCASWEQFLDPAAWNVQILGGQPGEQRARTRSPSPRYRAPVSPHGT